MGEETLTAFHKAGHAVICYRLGLTVGKISIIANKDMGTLGSTQQERQWGTPCERMDKAQVISRYAGFESERRFKPNVDNRGNWQDDEVAEVILTDRLKNYSEDTLRAAAAKLVKENWAQIYAVFTELERSKQVDADEWKIIVDAIDEGEVWEDKLLVLRERTKDLRKPK